MQFLELRWCEHGGAVVDFELVVEAEFFAEPDNALGLGAAEVVDCEDHC